MPTLPENTDTYLINCLREGNVVRWATAVMPLKVYIAPFQWYEKEKQKNAHAYMAMAWDAFTAWKRLTNGAVKFQRVLSLNESQINLIWRRVDRKSLGHCKTEWNAKGQIFGAEISIGLSDGLLFAQYNSPIEVKHTILHEVGHALGILGHSEDATDIMYVPHQYGVADLTARDVRTVEWLYSLPVGCHVPTEAHRLGLKPENTMVDFLEAWRAEKTGFRKTFEALGQAPVQQGGGGFTPTVAPPSLNTSGHLTLSIEEQQALLSQMGQFYMTTSSLLPTIKQPASVAIQRPAPKFQQFKWSGE
jgi:Matrixin